MTQTNLSDIINNTLRPWKDFKEYIDSRIQFLKLLYVDSKIDEKDQIVDTAPNEIVRMLWYGDIDFYDLYPVSGNKDYVPCTFEDNKRTFEEIFNQ